MTEISSGTRRFSSRVGIMLLLLSLAVQYGRTQGLYFPPLAQSAPWDTVSPGSLGWCTDKIAPLYSFLGQENTKGFLVLKDGKIVLEKYFGTFSKDSLWYWASAGKTVTSFLVGCAQEEQRLTITDKSSKYLGAGWTNCTPSQENSITVRNQLTMTSGLDDDVPDNHCTIDTCLIFKADAGSRWAYHNAPYTLLEKVLINATGMQINAYTQQKLMSRTGMSGFWFTIDYDNVFFSSVRSMARFGLLMQHKGAWNTDTLMHDTAYLHQMVNTSQQLNLSYGYLWWLNGKSSYMMPTVQYVFPGSYAPNAPSDMYAGLGKNGQIVSISLSKGIVMIRMGNPPSSAGSEIPNQFCDQIWQKLNEVMCNSNAIPGDDHQAPRLQIYPDPAVQNFTIEMPQHSFDIEMFDLSGRLILARKSVPGKIKIDVSGIKNGTYLVRVAGENNFVINRRLVILCESRY